jgi:multidrug efflux system membrane fusion protein
VLGDRAGALTVPAPVVQRSQQGTYAYVVKADNTVQSQPIKVASIQDGLAVIDDGLAAGDRVVLDGQYKLKPGVSIVEGAAAAAKAKGEPAAASAAGARP